MTSVIIEPTDCSAVCSGGYLIDQPWNVHHLRAQSVSFTIIQRYTMLSKIHSPGKSGIRVCAANAYVSLFSSILLPGTLGR